MAEPFRIDGLKELQTKLTKLSKGMEDEIDAELQASSMTIEAGAKRDAPKDVGFLANMISSYSSGKLEWSIVSAAEWSAFVEFGTRSRVVIPAGLESFASQYMGAKTATSLGAKQAIYGWCRRKGIEPKLWWPIFVSIMTKGIHPHPFFFNNFLIEKPKLIARIKSIVTDIK